MTFGMILIYGVRPMEGDEVRIGIMSVRQAVSNINTGVGSIVNWITFFTILSALLTWTSKNVTRFGVIGWPEAIFIGLAASSIVLLNLSVILVGWRYFNPLPASVQFMEGGAAPQARLDSTAVPDVGKLQALEARIKAAQDHIAHFLERFDNVDGQIEMLWTSGVDQKTELIEQLKVHREAQNTRVDHLADLHRIIDLKISGLQILLSVTPDAVGTKGWDRIKAAAMSFISDVSRLNYQFDREGLHLPYFTGEASGQIPENDEARFAMEYKGYTGLINAAIARLDQAENQAFEQVGPA